MMTWAEIKASLLGMAPAELRGQLVARTGETVPEIARYARMVNNEICGHPHKFSWTMREGTLTLTGASSYDLRTAFPDIARVYQVPSSDAPGREVPYQPLREYNLDPSGSIRMSIVGFTLKLNGSLSGTLTIPYYSNYLVVSATGTRQRDFLADGDFSIIPEEHMNMLTEGTLRYIKRKSEKQPFKIQVYNDLGQLVTIDPLTHYLRQAVIADKPIQQAIYTFRHAA